MAERKQITFSMDEALWTRAKDILGKQDTGSAANFKKLIDNVDPQKTAELENKIKELEERLAEASKTTNNDTALAAENLELRNAASVINERHKKEIDDLNAVIAQLKEEIQSFSEAEPEVKYVERELKEGERLMNIPDQIYKLMVETVARLNKKYNTNDTPDKLLMKMFIRYTVERYTCWFYPFVLNDRDIETITGMTAGTWKSLLK